MRPLDERLWSRVDKNGPVPEHAPEIGPCWVWGGAKVKLQNGQPGYGIIHLSKRDCVDLGRTGARTVRVHKLVFRLHTGRWAQAFLLHACDRHACCNPAHLREGTHRENMAEMKARGRCKGTHTGLRNGNAKLAPSDFDGILRDASEGMRTGEIAKKYGVSRRHIIRVRKAAA